MTVNTANRENVLDIYVGTDRSQLFAVSVLEHSISRHTQSGINVVVLDNEIAGIPEPDDIRHGARTGFSFARFAIPALKNYQGRALYLDADMLVFRNVDDLWSQDFNGSHILIAGDPGNSRRGGLLGRRRIRQCSVMLIDCEKCRWDAPTIVGKLGIEYSYEELMYKLCILEPGQIGETLPFQWNSLEYYGPETCLIHYTDMQQQPWVDPANPNGYLWVNELRIMIENGAISESDLENEIALGYLRPSLMDELKLSVTGSQLPEELIRKFWEHDSSRGFIKHRDINHKRSERLHKVRALENNLGFLELLNSKPSVESRRMVSRIKYLISQVLDSG